MGKYALLIGVGEYGNELLQPLPAAPNDVLALEEVLENASMGGFNEVKSVINPTHAGMTREIELWFQGREPDDLILLYFSGHGLKDDNRDLYFAACDTEIKSGSLLRSTATPARFVVDFIRSCSANSLLIILDCCFSGAFGNVLARDGGEVDLNSQLGAEGSVVLTSTSAVDYSFEEKGARLSIYTRFLVEGIATGAADGDGDGVITVENLHHYAARKVREVSPAMSPKIIVLKDEGHHIQLSRSPQRDPKLQYRKIAEKKAKAGKFSRPALAHLSVLRQELGISKEDARAIENEVLKPYQEYQSKLKRYEDSLREAVEDESTLSQDTIRDLADFRNHLGLIPEDVMSIEKEALNNLDLTSYSVKLEKELQENELSHRQQREAEALRKQQSEAEALRKQQRQSEELHRQQREAEALRKQQRKAEELHRQQRESEALHKQQRKAEALRKQQREARLQYSTILISALLLILFLTVLGYGIYFSSILVGLFATFIGLFASIFIFAFSLLIISKIPPIGVEIDSPIKALLAGAIIGAFNGIWGFFPNALRGFFAIISLGLIPLLGAIVVFFLSAWLIQGFRLRYGIWSAILGAIALAIIGFILNAVLRSTGLVPI
jgi:uncharacterized membrane protein YvlD (DUF360 family)